MNQYAKYLRPGEHIYHPDGRGACAVCGGKPADAVVAFGAWYCTQTSSSDEGK